MGDERDTKMTYARCGKSGLLLPRLSLGTWHNFGSADDFENARAIARTAFDHGITHFDLADNYGPEPGSAESNFGRILKSDFAAHRDELVVATKAGHRMWPGPYGDWGSRKHLIAGLDQSLRRLGLDYVDIFYHHRPDPETPLEETLGALAQIVRSGRALYVGLSKYDAARDRGAIAWLRANHVPLVVQQMRYSLLVRGPEESGLLDLLKDSGVGVAAFSPLAQGLLTDRYLSGAIAPDSRAAKNAFLKRETITSDLVVRLNRLNDFAQAHGETLAEFAVTWILSHPAITTAVVGASRPAQLLGTLKALAFPLLSSADRAAAARLLG